MTWQPLPGRGDQAGGREAGRPGPRTVGELLDGWARRAGAPGAPALQVVFSGWEAVVGAVVAAHARPVSLVDGTLVVVVDEPGWATEVRYLAADIVVRLAAAAREKGAGEAVVRRMEVRMARPGRRS